ncbi:hypothetical protein PS865_02590 [Pseudomonas fluorescens]|nr:hypothetical protein PS865_02590 [Pseudomonas fluorescens]
MKSKSGPIVPKHEARPGRVHHKLCVRCTEIVGVLDKFGETLQSVIADVTRTRFSIGKRVPNARRQCLEFGRKCFDTSVCSQTVLRNKRKSAGRCGVVVNDFVSLLVSVLCSKKPLFPPSCHSVTQSIFLRYRDSFNTRTYPGTARQGVQNAINRMINHSGVDALSYVGYHLE